MRNDKATAIQLRKSGSSYNEISNRLKIPKSTLSGWFKDIPYSKIIRNKNIISGRAAWTQNIINYNHARAQTILEQKNRFQKKEMASILQLSQRELLLVGTALYWAEGYKRGRWQVIFVNCDEYMIKLMMRYFLETCEVSLQKIRCQVQVHSKEQIKKSISYWSKITQIPQGQFRKSLFQISKSSKGVISRRLEYGTCRLIINDVTTVNRILGRIRGLEVSF